IGRAARAGILIKGGQHLEEISRITTFAVDKTGTLTEGRPRLVDVIALNQGAVAVGAGEPDAEGIRTEAERELVRLAAIAESGSGHPLGKPIVEAARLEGVLPAPDAPEEPAGMGVSAMHDGNEIVEGNRRLVERRGILLHEEAEGRLAGLRSDGHTPVLVALNGTLVGILGLADTARASAAPALAKLADIGVRRVVMLTGDDPLAAREVAREVGITEVHAGLLPEQKVEHVR